LHPHYSAKHNPPTLLSLRVHQEQRQRDDTMRHAISSGHKAKIDTM
jgi:hypothetical protein